MDMISADQFVLIKHMMSLSFIAMTAAAVFLGLLQAQLERPQRDAVVLAGVAAAVAAYHQFLIASSWDTAFVLITGELTDTGYGFDEALRLAGRILTLPLSVIALLVVLRLPPEIAARKLPALGGSAFLATLLSYLGAMTSDPSIGATLILLATLPLALIGYELSTGFKDARAARWTIVGSAALSHLLLLGSLLGISGAAPVALGSITDLFGTAGAAVMIYLFASRATQTD